ncbi:MAG TPA: DUF1800 domain-containing protein [Burkholderiales bacterium]|nr:DUF1800 domain-containing protein [Burkholderiales bacterium]
MRNWGLSLILLLSAGLAQATAMGDADAWHLLTRTGFAPNPQELANYAGLSRTEAVDRLLTNPSQQAVTPVPADLEAYMPRPEHFKDLSPDEKKQFRRQQARRNLELEAWWMQEMMVTPAPLTEHMTMFWHNHFVSSSQKVKSAQLMLRQNELLRRYALGNFGDMLHAMAKDPAMILYLDTQQNRKGQPNENFAREVMELFTLGIGHYSEQDVKEAARAYTGWSVDRTTGAFINRPGQHDNGIKTVLGQSGDFNGDDVLNILLEQPATAEWITRKLWRELISTDPDPLTIKRDAAIFRRHYEIRPLLRALLLSDAFWSDKNRGNLVKSPVELIVGSVRQLQIHPDPRALAIASRQLGQNVLAPPNVKGWPGGDAWINSTTLLLRKQFLDRITRGQEMPIPQKLLPDGAPEDATSFACDPEAWLSRLTPGSPQQRRAVQTGLLAVAPVDAISDNLPAAEYLHALLLDPAYQLK